MKFRLKAFSLHLFTSFIVVGLIVGGLYAGWYRGPGWYLSGVSKTVMLMAGVDVVLGPLLTFVIAAPGKARRELTRDLAVIAMVQLAALSYGTKLLWSGRPLYYAYSECCLTLVQQYDLDPADTKRALERNLPFAPHWYSLPRWVWAPLPDDTSESEKIIASAVSGEYDVTALPTHYRPWHEGLPSLRRQFVSVEESRFFLAKEKKTISLSMQKAGLPLDQKNIVPFTGRVRPLAAVYQPTDVTLLKLFEPK